MKNLILLAAALAVACSSSNEAPRTEKPVFAGSMLPEPFTNDEGWTVTVVTASVAVTEVTFTTQGESHVATLWRRMGDLAIPPAFAHPGHLAGGEVIGELPGSHLIEMGSGEELGTATLIVGRYDGANFTFEQAPVLDGASLRMSGTATRDEVEVAWTADITQDEGRSVVGLPMDINLETDDVEGLQLELLAVDPTDEADTLFDGVDFGADAELNIDPAGEDGARLLRATQRHDFWRVTAR